eukprot:5884868-Pyramimonas_sp.AAC.1
MFRCLKSAYGKRNASVAVCPTDAGGERRADEVRAHRRFVSQHGGGLVVRGEPGAQVRRAALLPQPEQQRARRRRRLSAAGGFRTCVPLSLLRIPMPVILCTP